MSTDNREQQLFPDVIEHYGTDQNPATTPQSRTDWTSPSRRRRSQRRTPPSSSMTSSRSTSSRTRSCRQTLNRSTRSRSSRPTSSRSTRPRRPLTPRRSSSPQSRPGVQRVGPRIGVTPGILGRRFRRRARTATPRPLRRRAGLGARPHSREPLVAIERTRGGFKSVVGRLRVQRPAAATALPAVDVPPSDPTEPVAVAGDGDGGGGRSGGMTFMRSAQVWRRFR